MPKFGISVTYVDTVIADDYDSALELVEQKIREGKIYSDFVEGEVLESKLVYKYNGFVFESLENLYDALIEEGDMYSFSAFINTEFDSYEIISRGITYSKAEEYYIDYQNECLADLISDETVVEVWE